MKQHPILMSTPMVQAILEGRKTQTRRIVKNGTPLGNFDETLKECPYGKAGDILWVRETHSIWNNEVLYKADYQSMAGLKPVCGWKPSIFMKREHSRINLLVKNVKIERLQEISESDAIEEGILSEKDNLKTWYYHYMIKSFATLFPRISYRSLWESINGVGSWEDNPLVWVVEFEKIIG